jgi:hypothetical protein
VSEEGGGAFSVKAIGFTCAGVPRGIGLSK